MNEPKEKETWLPVPSDSDFSIHNLPYGVFCRPDRQRSSNKTWSGGGAPRIGVAIGDQILDMALLHEAGLFRGTPVSSENIFARPSLNDFLALGRTAWTSVRQRITHVLADANPRLRDDRELRHQALVAQSDVTMLLPVQVGAFVDFYSSKEHATNVGAMFRDPNNPLLPNWKHLPVGYNGRASSIIVSGVNFHRPCGQTKADDEPAPAYGPTKQLDFELEVGFITGPGNELGTRINTAQARDHIFGMVLVNDWSARDIQKWEYVPLGPFLSKSFATSISPWIVTLDALDPFRILGPIQDPPVLPYLRCDGDWAYDLNLEVWLQVADMAEPLRITRTNFRYMYWNILQQLAHQTVNGTNVRPGDLYASGTVSGPTEDSRGCLLELTWKGTKPIKLPNGQERRFLNDGDTIIFRGFAQRPECRIGFGELRTTVLPVRD